MGAQLSAGRAGFIRAGAAAWIEEPVHFEPARPRLAFRTIWVSDIHLGTAGCQAELLLDFLKSTDCETLYLVGDIIDGWQLRKGWYWPPRHNDIVRCVLKKAKHGTRVVYVPGNHDEAFRDYVGLNLGGVELAGETIHVTADGRKLLVLHGDEFDGVVLYARWLAFLGDWAYTLLLKANIVLNRIRRRMGLPYWSLSSELKKRVKNAVQFISSFEHAVAQAASERGAHGVVCGHIHTAEIRTIGDVTYYNDGDWVESCTALVEHADGRMEIVNWADHKGAARRRRAGPAGKRRRRVKIALATDAWTPQVNGVVRSLTATVELLRRDGHQVEVIEPSLFRTIPCPTYPEIRLSIGCGGKVSRILDQTQPDSIHIATEGPIGWAARNWCVRNGRHYTTAFHTRFPDYVSIRTGIPVEWLWRLMRLFHGRADRTFAATPTLAAELHQRGLLHTHIWPRGVDLEQFNPEVPPHPALAGLRRPILLNVGRVAPEKNIEAFLDLDLRASKVVAGGGPALEKMKAAYPDVLFLGPKHGAELASVYTAADVFVFPSRTDTFGLVNIEAMACGLPVAAFPVPGPADIIGPDECGVYGGSERVGALDDDLGQAVMRALSADRAVVAAEARHYSWERCTGLFLDGLAQAHQRELAAAATSDLICNTAVT